MGFISLILTTPVFSQSKKTNTEIIENKSTSEEMQISSMEFIEISGNIMENPRDVNDKSSPIPGVYIKQKGTKNKVCSNFDGDFLIKIPTEDFNEKVILKFSYIGMVTKEVEVSKASNNLKIELIQSEAIMGEVIIVKYKKRNIFKRIRNLFK